MFWSLNFFLVMFSLPLTSWHLRLGSVHNAHNAPQLMRQKMELFENALQTGWIWNGGGRQVILYRAIKYKSKMTVIVKFLNFCGIEWTENIWWVFRVRPPLSNSSSVFKFLSGCMAIILVPRGRALYNQPQESWPLSWSNTGCPRCTDLLSILTNLISW